jgi:hypothetical protein
MKLTRRTTEVACNYSRHRFSNLLNGRDGRRTVAYREHAITTLRFEGFMKRLKSLYSEPALLSARLQSPPLLAARPYWA